MSSYVQRSLATGERIVATARLHWILWVRAWAALIFLGVFLIGVYLFVKDVAFLLSTEVVLTNSRLTLRKGLLQRHVTDLELSAVEAVNVDQGVWGRVLGFGRVTVHGSGEDRWSSPLIADPVAFRRAIEGALLARGALGASAGAATGGGQSPA